ncbi:hypothetical protein [uncultured Methanomethylovorans sp.]|nr:hypothetical protein [uncultured Methanomethylovorans sp.]
MKNDETIRHELKDVKRAIKVEKKEKEEEKKETKKNILGLYE